MSGRTRLSCLPRRIEWKKNAETQKQDHAELGARPIAAARKRQRQEPAPTCARKRPGSRSSALRNRHAPAARAAYAWLTPEGCRRCCGLLGKPRIQDRKQQDRALAAGAAQALHGAEDRARGALYPTGRGCPGCHAGGTAIED